jgi:hypothetical protein
MQQLRQPRVAPPPELYRQQQREAQNARQLVHDYQQLFNSEVGRRVLADLEQYSGYYGPSAIPGMRAEDVFLNEGVKNPIRLIHEYLKAKPDDKEPPTKALI